MLLQNVPLFNELGIDTRWEVIEGDQTFFEVTKAMHNALQGFRVNITGCPCWIITLKSTG